MSDGYLTLAQVATRVGVRRGGRPTKTATVRSWALHGLDGVVLRSELRGGIRMARWEWVEEFFAARTAGCGTPAPRVERSAAAEARHQRDVRRRLEAMGAI